MKEVWWWRQTGVGPFPARQPPPSQERQEGGLCAGGALPGPRAGRLRARQHTPKAPPASGGGAPSSVCENLYQSHGTQQPAQGFTSGLFHRHGSGRMVARQPRNHACGNARRWEKLYHQTLTNAFLKKLHRDCQCLDFVLEVPVSVVPSFRVSDLVRYYVGI